MNAAAKVIIVDDHPLIAQATKELMKQLEGVEVAGVAANGAQCLELIEEVEPDIVLLDFHLPDRSGDELAAVIKNSHPDVQIIIFTGIDVTDLYNHFIQIGVSGILSKESDGEVIKLMVKAVLHGQTLLPQTQLRQVRFLQGGAETAQLTEDEMHIMMLVTQGSTNEQIAKDIHMSKRSVDNYLKKIYDKLGVRARAQAVERFLQLQQKAKMRNQGVNRLREEVIREMRRIALPEGAPDDLSRLLADCIGYKEGKDSLWSDLAIFLHRMLGGSSQTVFRRAAALELMILALDIMDDLQDNDHAGMPWMQCPPAYAMNAMLSLLMSAVSLAAEEEAGEGLGSPVQDVCGQVIRAAMGQQLDVSGCIQTEEQYIDMVLRKSGSLFRLACRLGASGCKVDGETARLLDEMADALGVAAQIGNDVSDVLRFDLKNDLLQRKKTLPVLYMLSDPEDRFPLLRSYYEGEASLALFLSRKQECLNYIRESGCVEYAEAIQSIYRNRALKALSELPGDPYPKQQLRERLLLSLGGSL